MGIAISGIIATCCFTGSIQQICLCFRKGLCSTSIATTSYLTRVIYAILLTFGVIASCLCLTGHIEKFLMKIPHLCQPNELIVLLGIFINQTGTTNTCESFVGYSGVYRICFSFTIFHIFMTIILYRIRTKNDWRNGLQNGFWFFKIILIIGIIILNFLWPISKFNRVLLFIGMIGGFLFIIIQMIFLIDFIYKIIEHWLEKISDGYRRYTYLLIFLFIFFYGLTISMTIALFIVYAHSKECMPNQIFITLNIVFCLLITIVSILPQIQVYNPSSGLVQTAFISFYSTYLVWSSLSSNPAHGIPQCNPSIFGIALLPSNATRQESVPKDYINWASIIGLVLFFIMLLYSTISTSAIKMSRADTSFEYNNNALTVTRKSSSIKVPIIDNTKSQDKPIISSKITHIDNEKDNKNSRNYSIITNQTIPIHTEIINNNNENEILLVDYNYSFFHFVYALASLYAMITLTNWYQPSQTLEFFNMSSPAYWIKIISSWLCLILYLWTILAPCLLQHREF